MWGRDFGNFGVSHCIAHWHCDHCGYICPGVSVAAIVLSFWASAIGLAFGRGLGGMILGFFAQADSVYSYVAYYGACVGAVGIGILLGLFSFWLTKVTSRGMAHLFRRMVDRRKHEKQVS